MSKRTAPLKIFNLKLSLAQHKYIDMTAKAQGHKNKSLVIKRLIDREMNPNP